MSEKGKESRKSKHASGTDQYLATERTTRAKQPPKEEQYDEQEKGSDTVILEGIKKVGTSRKKSSKTSLQAKGTSLRVKFALFISIVSAALCLVSGLTIYFQIEKELLIEIDRKGAGLVRAVAGLAVEFNEKLNQSDVEALQQYEKAKAEYENDVESGKLKGAEKQEREQMVKGLMEQVNRIRASKNGAKTTFTGYLESLVAFYIEQENAQEKEKIASEEILSVAFIRPGNPDSILLQSGAGADRKAAGISGIPQTLSEKVGDTWYETSITVLEGSMATQKARQFKVRAYRMPAIPGQIDAMVILSQLEIVKTMDKILMITLMTTFGAILLGILISMILANQVTKPVQRLVRDIEIVANGDLGHTTPVMSKDEIGVLAHTFNIMTQNLKAAHETELGNQARVHEMKIASEIQTNLLPSSMPNIKGYEVAAFYRPAKEVGGDYYDFIEIDAQHIGFIVADVSGKSIPGSMVMAMARALIRMEALRNNSPAKTFTEVNKILARDICKGMFVTAMYGILDIAKGELCLSSAGHNPAIIWRHGLKQNELVNPKGLALGLKEGPTFEKLIREERYQLQSGDKVILYTDGVPEAMSPKNEEFGDDRFCDIVTSEASQNSEHLIGTLVKSLDDWKKSCPQSDDITIVALKKS